jgi:hypothetical protein
MATAFFILSLVALFFWDQDRRLRRRNTIDEIKGDPRLVGFLIARPAAILLASIAGIVLVVGFVRAF